ncbi:MAG: energy transducer TonB [Saprospiraceae bacterium]
MLILFLQQYFNINLPLQPGMKNSIDDILFERRNKDYGAYALRGLYNKNMARGILFAIFIFFLLIELPSFIHYLRGVIPTDPGLMEMKEIILEEAPPIDPRKALPPPPKVLLHPKIDQIKTINPDVKKDIEIKEKEPVPDEKTVQSDLIDSIRNNAEENPTSSMGEGNGADNNGALTSANGSASNEIYNVVEEAPRFPGCEIYPTLHDRLFCAAQKLKQYLNRNIHYPENARKTGVQGRCIISFVVEKDGSISNARIIEDIGSGCGEEALRVVNSMNTMNEPWRPGKQRGNPVRVQFNLPINFNLH